MKQLRVTKQMKIGIGIILVIALYAVFVVSWKAYIKAKPYTLKELESIGTLYYNTAEMGEDGIISLHFNTDSDLNLEQVDVYAYTTIDSIPNFTKLDLDKERTASLTLDLVSPVDSYIQKVIKQTNFFSYSSDYDFSREAVMTIAERITVHVVVLPKGYFDQHKDMKEEAYFYEENDVLHLDEQRIESNLSMNAYTGNYSTYTMYVMSLSTNKLSMVDFLKLVKVARKGVPRMVDFYESEFQEYESTTDISGLLSDVTEDYESTAIYNVLVESYTIGEYFPLPVYSPREYFLKEVTIVPNEQVLVSELDVAAEIEESQAEYKKLLNKQELKERVTGTGELTNCYFNYKNVENIGEHLILKQIEPLE